MLDKKFSTKQSKVKTLSVLPNKKYGRTGDINIVRSNLGSYLTVKTIDGWKVVKLSDMVNHNEVNVGKLSVESTAEFKSNIKTIGNSDVRGTSQLTGDTTITGDLKKPVGSKIYFDSDQTTSNNYITSSESGKVTMYVDGVSMIESSATKIIANNMDLRREEIATPSAGTNDDLLIENTGNARLTLKTGGSTYDPYINYVYSVAGETLAWHGWSVGMDSSATKTFKWKTFDAGGAGANPSSGGTERMSLTNAGALDCSGDISAQRNSVANSDYICCWSGNRLGYRTGANVKADFGVPTNYITNDADDIMAGTLTIDKNTSATSTSTITGAIIDYDHIGISASGQTVTGVGLDVSMRCDTVTHVGAVNQTGININMIAETDGQQIQTGIKTNVSGGDKNYDIQLIHDSTNYCTFETSANGATTIQTVDSDGAAGHLTLDPNGALIISGADTKISATQKLYLDGGSDTYIYESGADIIDFYVGDSNLVKLAEKGSDGGYLQFNDCSVGFVREEATFSITAVIGSAGTDDTDIDFRFSNKFRLEIANDITNMNLIFPAVSGNFVLVIDIAGSGGGDHDVTNWKVYESDETAATTTDVMWAGGSVPAFTSGASVDIVSFYWDAFEQQAYGVASLAFATP